MNKAELKILLNKSKVPDHFYNLDSYGNIDQRVCLEFESGKWLVYYSEKGIRFDMKAFSTEDEACNEVFNRMKVHVKRSLFSFLFIFRKPKL